MLGLNSESESGSGLGLELGCIQYIKLLIQYTINWVAIRNTDRTTRAYRTCITYIHTCQRHLPSVSGYRGTASSKRCVIDLISVHRPSLIAHRPLGNVKTCQRNDKQLYIWSTGDMSIPQFCKVLCFIWAMSSASAAQTPLVKPLFYGFDFGTSGVRCCLIDSVRNIVHEDSLTWSSMNVVPPKVDIAKSWEIALDQLLERTPEVHRKSIMRMCISGTSSSALIYDTEISAISRQPRMYDFNVLKHGAVGDYGGKAIEAIQKTCPKGSAANAPTSTLAKVLSWNAESRIKPSERLAHQADYLIHHITSVGSEGKNAVFISDWHNALKLGYSVHSLDYPKWMTDLLHEQGIGSDFIPAVIEPGQIAGAVNPRLQSLGYSEHCQVVAG